MQHEHPALIESLTKATVESSGIGIKHVVSVASDAPVLAALRLLHKHHLTGVSPIYYVRVLTHSWPLWTPTGLF